MPRSKIAIPDKVARIKQTRLARECAKLDRSSERSLAEEGLAVDVLDWPEY